MSASLSADKHREWQHRERQHRERQHREWQSKPGIQSRSQKARSLSLTDAQREPAVRIKAGWIYFAAGGFVWGGEFWGLFFGFFFCFGLVFFWTLPISLVATESRQSPRTTWGIRSVTGQDWGSKSGHQGWQQALYRMSHLTRPSFPFLRQTLEFTIACNLLCRQPWPGTPDSWHQPPKPWFCKNAPADKSHFDVYHKNRCLYHYHTFLILSEGTGCSGSQVLAHA